MKAYLFIETGEVRRPNGGEYYIRSGGIMGCPVEGYPYSRTIVTRHEIEIPDDHSEFHCWSGNLSETNVTHIPLSRPKKVKKTVYLYAQKIGGKTVYSVFENAYEPNSYPVEIEVEE